MLSNSFIKKTLISKQKFGTVTKVKLGTKIKKQSALFWNFGISIILLLWR